MRVISGKAKGRRLKKAPGGDTRPMMDRVKENLFNLIADSVFESRWLDLFAGTGQVGIEALSRGAARVVFVDNSRQAIQTIRANLTHTQLSQGADIIQGDAFTYLKRFSGERFDLVFVAPPQYLDLWLRSLKLLDERSSAILLPGATVVVQIDPKEYAPQELETLAIYDQRRYGNTQLIFYGCD